MKPSWGDGPSKKSEREEYRLRAAAVFADHQHGDSFAQVGKFHGISRQRAHQIYKRETSRIGGKDE